MTFTWTKTVGAALALFAIPAATQAADMPTKAYARNAQAAAPFTWTGVYLGAHLGYAMAKTSGFYDQTDAAGATDLSGLKMNGLVYGGQIGFNWQTSNFVFGAEFDGSFGKAKKTIYTPEPAPRGPDPVTGERSTLMSIRARLGFAFDRTLVYGTGGIGWAKRSLTITEMFDNTTGTISSNKSGAVYGAGIEHAFLNNVSVRLEYLHYQVSTTVALNPAVFHDADPGDSVRFGNIDVIRLGANYRF